jgi:hypothetical protein
MSEECEAQPISSPGPGGVSSVRTSVKLLKLRNECHISGHPCDYESNCSAQAYSVARASFTY